ncbi:glycosyltransferase family 4 protein [Tenacibaculum finnmarkense]|uniref:glycosyltransferase family 4 protein n=1 Tax=Tenacibaculum finnmarkense TaxID=2781243 RepID=UPI001EFAA131|nr:glycosyltransferase family 4 protein [Tenacibaculum finnmarkense]MCG8734319.1 glycosyltransferase family 4 protein [Tenacibaculum finnmarkense]MCG8803616.1 glycosyltransferase family 4 protein [Tenacibaculum finnmarkense]MCG8826431.1 glycosyltransferase family 4 protein [Tenacibaculum finnmarkense]
MVKSKPKILLCAPHGGAVGGIAKWTGHILKYYEMKKDISVELSLFNMKRKNPIYANTSKLKRIYSGLKEYYNLIRSYKNKIVVDKIDVVHITSSASFGLFRDLLMLKYAKKSNVKSIIHFRFGRIPELFEKNNWEKRLIDKVIKKADKVIVIDKLSHEILLNYGYKNIVLLPNPLAPIVDSIIKQNNTIKRIDRTLMFVGHIVETKGVFELVRVCKEIPNIQLKMIGAVSEETKERLIKLGGINHQKWLNFVGELDFTNVIKEMLSAGVFVLPTYTEGFPNVIIESMACACPIVASSVGAIPEMLDLKGNKDYGICIEAKNEKQLKEAIEKMINNRDFAIQSGNNAQRRVNELYTMQIVCQGLESIWKSMV